MTATSVQIRTQIAPVPRNCSGQRRGSEPSRYGANVDHDELQSLRAENERLRHQLADLQRKTGPYPLGHFHSPIPDLEEVRRDADKVYVPDDRDLPGIDRDEARQWAVLNELARFAGQEHFARHATADRRYYWDNRVFQYADAFVLYAMLRRLQPRRWIEIGSGFSSATLLDALDRHPEITTRLLFVDPDSARVHALLRPADHARCEYLQQRVQDIPIERFDELGAGDVLFIDSSHVSKVASDVNWLFFEVVPRLRPGVIVHVHDIPPAFEYSREWIEAGWAWNEAYLVRAFLMFNQAFRFEIHPAFLAARDPATCMRLLPECPGVGTSLWLRRV